MVQDPYQQDVVRTLEKKPQETQLLDMKEYGQSEKVIVDIITLDSESCAPCQYMVEAVKRVAPHFEGIVEWREHTIKDLEGVTFMSSLMVKNIPAICIDGKIAFVSQIPPRDKLIGAIQQRINEKLRMKIQTKRSELLILGKSEEECKPLKERTEQAMTELGKYIQISVITDEEEVRAHGIVETPAVIALQRTIKSQGGTPHLEVIKEWLKAL
jgi:uroporphyrinogen decarboxylase